MINVNYWLLDVNQRMHYWQDQYWDSIKYGVLREEWNVFHEID
ncbi:MAG: hypothetical protein ABS911_08935 [Carnobacterium sp.]